MDGSFSNEIWGVFPDLTTPKTTPKVTGTLPRHTSTSVTGQQVGSTHFQVPRQSVRTPLRTITARGDGPLGAHRNTVTPMLARTVKSEKKLPLKSARKPTVSNTNFYEELDLMIATLGEVAQKDENAAENYRKLRCFLETHRPLCEEEVGEGSLPSVLLASTRKKRKVVMKNCPEEIPVAKSKSTERSPGKLKESIEPQTSPVKRTSLSIELQRPRPLDTDRPMSKQGSVQQTNTNAASERIPLLNVSSSLVCVEDILLEEGVDRVVRRQQPPQHWWETEATMTPQGTQPAYNTRSALRRSLSCPLIIYREGGTNTDALICNHTSVQTSAYRPIVERGDGLASEGICWGCQRLRERLSAYENLMDALPSLDAAMEKADQMQCMLEDTVTKVQGQVSTFYNKVAPIVRTQVVEKMEMDVQTSHSWLKESAALYREKEVALTTQQILQSEVTSLRTQLESCQAELAQIVNERLDLLVEVTQLRDTQTQLLVSRDYLAIALSEQRELREYVEMEMTLTSTDLTEQVKKLERELEAEKSDRLADGSRWITERYRLNIKLAGMETDLSQSRGDVLKREEELKTLKEELKSSRKVMKEVVEKYTVHNDMEFEAKNLEIKYHILEEEHREVLGELSTLRNQQWSFPTGHGTEVTQQRGHLDQLQRSHTEKVLALEKTRETLERRLSRVEENRQKAEREVKMLDSWIYKIRKILNDHLHDIPESSQLRAKIKATLLDKLDE